MFRGDLRGTDWIFKTHISPNKKINLTQVLIGALFNQQEVYVLPYQ